MHLEREDFAMTEQDTAPAVIPPVSDELALAARREIALRTTDAVAEILGQDVTVRSLERMAASPDTSRRLTGKRALRAVEALARENSPVIRNLGEVGIYSYAEAVIMFGADERTYLGLASRNGLKAEEATGLYSLREQISEYSDGKNCGFPTIERLLEKMGLSVAAAASDPETTVALLDRAGLLRDTPRGRDGSPTISSSTHGIVRMIEDDPDGSLSESILEAQRGEMGRPLDEIDDEGEVQEAHEIAERLAELIYGTER